MNLLVLFPKATLSIILSSSGLTLVLQDIYALRRTCFPLKKMDEENLYLGNSSTFKVLGVGNAILKMIFGKLFTLNNVLQVANIRKNLVPSSLISKCIFKMIFKSDKFIISSRVACF
jgi:hypothetical protein